MKSLFLIVLQDFIWYASVLVCPVFLLNKVLSYDLMVYTIFPSRKMEIMPPLWETTIPIDFVTLVIPAIDE
jgi:hypothetical protein